MPLPQPYTTRVGATLAVARPVRLYMEAMGMEGSKRKNLRLRGYDYFAPGAYFITICTYSKACTLSRVHPGNLHERASVELTELGRVTHTVLQELSARYGVYLAACTIMPNHIHMLLTVGNDTCVPVGRFVGAVKSVVSNRWRAACNSRGVVMGKLWQRDFYDHIIRNEADYLEKWKYIDENPDKWDQDELYCKDVR